MTVEERLFAVKVLIDFAVASLKGAGSFFWFLVTEEGVDFDTLSAQVHKENRIYYHPANRIHT